MEDIVQIRKCLAGQSEAFEALVAKYKNLVFSIALHTLSNKNDAADATQEVFLKAWANLSKYNADFSFKTWIARITVNHCINLNQKSRRITVWNEEEMEMVASGTGCPEEALLNSERRDAVKKAIEGLPEMYRVVIQLYHQQSMTYEEICNVTGHPMSLVKNRIYRARKLLAENLRAYQNKTTGEEGKSWIAVKHGI